MKLLIYSLFCTILVNSMTGVSVLAADEFPSFKITIIPAEHKKTLHTPLQRALRKERDRLEQSGITMSDSKLIRREIGTLGKVLNSEGYYRHHIDFDRSADSVTYRLDTGRVYRTGTITIESPQTDIKLPTTKELGLTPDKRLRAATVLSAQDTLRQFIRDNNCVYQINTSYEVTLDHETATGNILFLVKPAAQVNIDQIFIEGLVSVEEPYIREKLTLKEGQCYQTRAIEMARLRLLQTGLFSTVESQVTPPAEGKVNIRLELKERHHRTIKVGVGYSTDESLSFTAGWQHRNFFGRAEVLEVESKVSKLFRILDSTLTFPAFKNTRQALILEAELATENLEAYDSRGMTLSALLKRRLARNLAATGGVQYQFKSVQESGGENTFGLLSFPASLEYDSRDNILDPSKGWVTALEVQPFVDTLDPDIMFLKSTVAASIYHTLQDFRFTPTLAARTVVGSISGIATENIPASERFYSGGGGSVRGYPFRELGPLINSDPRGGRSLVEVSLEARFRVRENWGGVVFVDGGNVYDEQLPQFGKQLRWAVGVGVRYYTAFAPVRFDIAFPINRRSGIDDAFQIYISLAQAF